MSLLDGSGDIKIKLYYKYSKVGVAEKLVILDDAKAEEMMKNEEKAKEVETLETGWRMLTWKEQNEVSDLSSRSINPKTGEKQFSYVMYRDSVVKRCLKSWDITMNEKPVPVTAEAIDKLPGTVVLNLFERFEKLLDYSEEELGN